MDEAALKQVNDLIEQGQAVLATAARRPGSTFVRVNTSAYSNWRSRAVRFLERDVGLTDAAARAFNAEVNHERPGEVETGIGILEGVRADLVAGQLAPQTIGAPSALALLESICDRFHVVSRQLRERHAGRPTLDVADEYDAQDLLHALLRLNFDDVRPEENTGSYAGKSSRMDFLLKREQLVIEVKVTRPGLGAKELGSQLIEDIVRYEQHPDCKALVCFVYDPLGLIGNARGLEDDLARLGKSLPVRVFIRPI